MTVYNSVFLCVLLLSPLPTVLQAIGVDIFTLGQYLQPTDKHLSVTEFVTPEKFEHWRKYGEEQIGFRCVTAG